MNNVIMRCTSNGFLFKTPSAKHGGSANSDGSDFVGSSLRMMSSLCCV